MFTCLGRGEDGWKAGAAGSWSPGHGRATFTWLLRVVPSGGDHSSGIAKPSPTVGPVSPEGESRGYHAFLWLRPRTGTVSLPTILLVKASHRPSQIPHGRGWHYSVAPRRCGLLGAALELRCHGVSNWGFRTVQENELQKVPDLFNSKLRQNKATVTQTFCSETLALPLIRELENASVRCSPSQSLLPFVPLQTILRSSNSAVSCFCWLLFRVLC